MNAPDLHRVLGSAPTSALPGTWKLARGRAVTLRPSSDGILRIAHGQVWATTDGPHGRAPDDSGDHVLHAGRSMFVRAGQRVVIEAWNAHGASYFAWDPVFARAPAARPRINRAIVLQPLADLRLALGQAVHALGQLGLGLAQLAWHAARDRVRPPAPARCPGLPS